MRYLTVRRYPHRSAPRSRRLVARLHAALGERYGAPGIRAEVEHVRARSERVTARALSAPLCREERRLPDARLPDHRVFEDARYRRRSRAGGRSAPGPALPRTLFSLTGVGEIGKQPAAPRDSRRGPADTGLSVRLPAAEGRFRGLGRVALSPLLNRLGELSHRWAGRSRARWPAGRAPWADPGVCSAAIPVAGSRHARERCRFRASFRVTGGGNRTLTGHERREG